MLSRLVLTLREFEIGSIEAPINVCRSYLKVEGVENDDNNELGVEVNHLSCTMHVSGVIDEKG